MQFFILPLLAALHHYTPTDDTWKNGMEVRYNMTYDRVASLVNLPSILSTDIPKVVTSNFSAGILCQLEPNTPEYMQCRMVEPDITLTLEYSNGTITEKLDKTNSPIAFEFFTNHFTFDVKFDKPGVENLLVTPVMEEFWDDIRTIAYPLHAGVDMDNLTVGNYEGTDKFWTGDCDTKYEVMMTHEVIGEPDPVVEGQWETGKMIVINKKRNMDKCLGRVGYDPPTMKTYSMADATMVLEIKSSESHIVADNTKFISMTHFDGVLYTDKEPNFKTNLIDTIKLEYDSVTPMAEKRKPHVLLKPIGLAFGNK